MPENKTLTAKFDQVEMNALAFAVKNRMAIIEMKALSFHGETLKPA